MYKTFNMGIGFCIIVNKRDADNILLEYGDKFEIRRIGAVIDKPVVRIRIKDEVLELV